MSTNDDDGIYRVDTVPPPPGEGDAYNAPTRIGPMAGAIVEELLAQSKRDEEQQAAKARSEHSTAPPPKLDEEPVDPAKLLNVESLTAQLHAAEKARAESAPPEPVAAANATAPKNVEAEESAPVAAVGSPVTARGSSAADVPRSTNTLLLVALLVVLAGVGIYLLRH